MDIGDLKYGLKTLPGSYCIKNKNSNILKKSSNLRREKTAGAATADRETACGCGGKNMTNLKRHPEGAPPCD